ncbi:MAG: hemolysin XhlA family protein [Mycoplasmataceae bacterium]|nr:hemolysin XhlA family protein [Mycoplasmataceae bacterium]
MVFNNNKTDNTNKPQDSKKQESIIKKIGKKENYYVNESTNKYIKEGDEIVMSKFVYSRRVPKPDIIGEILKRLEKMDSKLDIQGEEIKEIKERITNIEQVQKAQGEEIKEIKEVQKAQGEKLNNVIFLNNLKTE